MSNSLTDSAHLVERLSYLADKIPTHPNFTFLRNKDLLPFTPHSAAE